MKTYKQLKKRTFSVYTRDDNESYKISKIIKEVLVSRDWKYEPDHPELVICVGGDGTIIRAIHHFQMILDEVFFVGIHTGTLGFLTDYNKEELGRFLLDIQTEKFELESSTIIEINGDEMNSCIALNEVRIGNFAKTVRYDVYIDGEFFERSVGSGLCISTQAGSTAVNRSLMGAVVDDGLDILQLCEIMPVSHNAFHSLKNPYIMNAKRVITIECDEFDDSILAYDHLERNLKGVHKIFIRASDKKVNFARFRPYSYLRRLKSLH